MNISWVISFSNNAIPIFKEKIASFVKYQQKRIGLIVFIALAALLDCYTLSRCFWFKARKLGHNFIGNQKLQENLEESAIKYKDILALEPKNPDALRNYAVTLHQLGNLEEANAKFNEALTFVKEKIPKPVISFI